MNALRIYREYKFKKGESEFYISEGQVLKVNTISGDIYNGKLIEVGEVSECFDIKTENGVITIDCEDVIDIMPLSKNKSQGENYE